MESSAAASDLKDLAGSAPSPSALRWSLLGRFISSRKSGAHHRSPCPCLCVGSGSRIQ